MADVHGILEALVDGAPITDADRAKAREFLDMLDGEHEANGRYVDLVVIAYNEDKEDYQASARAAADDPWVVIEEPADRIDVLLSLARDIMTGG
jgi:hypothetical protein